MNLTVIADGENVFAGCECIKGYAFKNTDIGEKCALLPVITAVLGVAQDTCAHLSRIECLLPHRSPV